MEIALNVTLHTHTHAFRINEHTQQIHRIKNKLTCKSVAFLYIDNKQSKKEIKETISLTIALKIIKYLEINFQRKYKSCTIKNI